MSKPWSPPPDYDRYKNEALSRAMYEYVAKEAAFYTEFFKRYSVPAKPPTRWQRYKWRVRNFIDRWMPRVHLGECNHDDCE